VTTTWVRILTITAAADEASAAVAGHRDHVLRLRGEGRLVASYALADETGFVDVFRAADLWEAQSVASSSPLVARGLGAWQLHRIEDPGT
jgi:uncharacterized protein YciI